MPAEFTVKEYSQATWADFAALFGKHKGVRGGCRCTFHLCTSSQYDKMTKDERRDFQKALAHQGLGSGLIAYDGDTPIAWHQFGLERDCPDMTGCEPVKSSTCLQRYDPAGASPVYL